MPKYNLIFKGVTTLVGEGLIFSEGERWRRKRRIISRLFTHDMVLSNIPTMVSFTN